MADLCEASVDAKSLLETETVSTSAPLPSSPAVPSRTRSPSLFKPHQRGRPVTSGQKRAALNVYSRLRARNQSKSVCDMLILASELTGISFKSLLRIRKDCRSGVKLTTHGKQRPNARGKRSRLALLGSSVVEAIERTVKSIRDRNEVATPAKVCQIINANGDLPDFNPRTMQRILGDLGYTTKRKPQTAANGATPPPPTDHLSQSAQLPPADRTHDDATLSAIRRKIHDFHGRRETPTAPRVLQAINSDDLLPDVSERTLRRVVGEVGFDVVKRSGGRDAVLVERDEVVLNRRRYLRQIWHFRQRGRRIFYVDETWLPCANTTNRLEEEDDGVWVMLAGNEHGFLSGSEWVQRAKQNQDAVIRPEVDAARFEAWFVGQLLPNLEPESVIVLDDAPCHAVKTEAIPDETTDKAVVQQWLTDKGVPWFPDSIKRELLVQVERVRRQYDEYRLDVLAALDGGHTVLHLPARHGELNPAETICDQLRSLVVAEGCSSHAAKLEVLARGCMAALSPDHWAGCVAHSGREEERMWQVDAQADAEDVERRDGDDESSGHESSDEYASDDGSSGGE